MIINFNIFRIGLLFLLTFSGLIIIQDKIISLSSGKKIYQEALLIPAVYNCALVLGSGNTPDPASPNYSFEMRIKKTGELWKTGKIKKIIVSGASNKIFYNEPNDMKFELIKMGIPSLAVYPDHGGLRTFLSVKRAKQINPVASIIIISQRKQLERALYIAGCLGVKAVGLEASPTPFKNTILDDVHEMLSRMKCRWDCLMD